ncbi:MAG: DUF1501 domain-containing protein [Polyangiaceae bacterium]|nr:DUF1501 domain-containing protein [Polyangiaceae bacterium]
MKFSPSISRRSMLQLGLAALGAAALKRDEKAALADVPPKGAADACIVLWLNGGPSHLDTFDPKPGRKVMGPLRAIGTAAAGIQLGEHLPLLAKEAQKFAVLRGLSSKEGSHERAQSLGHTGYSPNPTAAYPSLGSWASKRLGARDPELPAYVSLGGPGGAAGFFGAGHAPFVVSEPGKSPDDTDPGVLQPRFERRARALAFMEDMFSTQSKAPVVEERRAVYDKAFRLMRSPKLRAFDLEDEPAATRTAYGDTPFGKGCLTARRLVEAGVRFVEVTLDGWDTHQDNFEKMKKLCGALDPAMSALLGDLSQRSLLDRTVVLCLGEFGRTPKISGDDGRDHHPAAFSALIAGGGLRGGIAVGQTDDDGEKVVADKTSVADVFATVASRLGLDPAEMTQAPSGRPVSLTDGGMVIEKLLPGK